ncbi:hypothetical protein VSR17_31030, partial [Cupriavidus taiwanensis]
RRTRPTRRRRWRKLSGGYAASEFPPPAKMFVATPDKMIVAAQATAGAHGGADLGVVNLSAGA